MREPLIQLPILDLKLRQIPQSLRLLPLILRQILPIHLQILNSLLESLRISLKVYNLLLTNPGIILKRLRQLGPSDGREQVPGDLKLFPGDGELDLVRGGADAHVLGRELLQL